jgi:regulator of sigma E protease
MFESFLIWPLVIVGIGFLIFFHELGHYLLAKRHGVRVDVFSIGFGPAIWKRKVGVTEYRIAWIPLGGYVKLAGELPTEDRTPAPDELWAKPAFARLQIFAAGAVMNLILAFPLCVLANFVGKRENSPVVGYVGIPESYAGMQPGDTIVEVDGHPIRTMQQYRLELLRRTVGTQTPVKVRRGDEVLTLTVPAMSSKYHRVETATNKIDEVKEGTVAAERGIQPGEYLDSLSWTDPEGGPQARTIIFRGDLEDALNDIKGLPFTMRVRGSSGIKELDAQLPTRTLREFPWDHRLMEPLVGKVEPGYPAEEVLEEGDRIRKLAGREIKSWHDIREALRDKANEKIQVVVLRAGVERDLEIRPVRNSRGHGMIGIGPKESDVIADVVPDSYYWKAGLRPGDRLRRVGTASGDVKVSLLFQEPKADEKSRFVEVARGEPITLTVQEREVPDGARLGLGFVTDTVERSSSEWSVGDRIGDGLVEPYKITKLTFELLFKLVSGQESLKGLAGPVGIFHVSYKSAESSTGNFIWLLALITVNLGIINLLPLPILDGGHMWILLTAEKIQGRPPSERFLMVFQYAGLALFLFLAVFVTFNDISRLLGGGF